MRRSGPWGDVWAFVKFAVTLVVIYAGLILGLGLAR